MQRYAGKRLLLTEIALPKEELEALVQAGKVSQQSSLIIKDGYVQSCRRCGTTDRAHFAKHECAKCGRQCTYCRSCIQLGKVSECVSLYYFPRKNFPQANKKHTLTWQGQLSAEQEEAAEAVIDAIIRRSSLLIWAVAGAGKTELLFRAIVHALNDGLQLAIATPRVDVVKELELRFRTHFPKTEITALYGGSEQKGRSELVIATTQQMMRFYEAFDVMIIDEVDAFPYSIDDRLHYAVANAKTKKATLIYLTATPNQQLMQTVERIIKIPIRHHRHPLPVPTFIWTGRWQKTLQRKQIPAQLENWLIKKRATATPVLLFVPTIAILKQLSAIFHLQKIPHYAVHANSPNRHEQVEAFRSGRVSLLITTTILERGVTFPRVEVAILGAEQPLFTKEALIQIAGRVGRDAQYPTGDVCFFYFGITAAMKAAKREIDRLNEEGMR